MNLKKAIEEKQESRKQYLYFKNNTAKLTDGLVEDLKRIYLKKYLKVREAIKKYK